VHINHIVSLYAATGRSRIFWPPLLSKPDAEIVSLDVADGSPLDNSNVLASIQLLYFTYYKYENSQ